MADIIKQLYGDEAKSNRLFPKTKISAVEDADGNVLSEDLTAEDINQLHGISLPEMGVAIDNRIKKFYTSNLLAENVNDSDDGVIRNIKLYGKGSQGANPSPSNPQPIHSVVNPTLTIENADGTESKSASIAKTLNAIPVSSGGNVTIDGQQYIADYVDVEKKKLIRNIGVVNIGNLNWAVISENRFRSGNINEMAVMGQRTLPVLCDIYLPKSNNEAFDANWNYVIYNFNNVNQLIVHNHDYSDANAFKTAMNGVIVYFKLATPTEESLTDEEVADFLALRSYYGATNATVTSNDLNGASEFLYPCSIKNFVEYVKEQLGDTRQFIYNIDDITDKAYIDAQYALALLDLS